MDVPTFIINGHHKLSIAGSIYNGINTVKKKVAFIIRPINIKCLTRISGTNTAHQVGFEPDRFAGSIGRFIIMEITTFLVVFIGIGGNGRIKVLCPGPGAGKE
jgi:hypothetical protein